MKQSHPAPASTQGESPEASDTERISKYREIIVFFENAIANGQYRAGERLPSESELVRQFGLSRPTISRAMRELQLGGLVERRVGSGSYVKRSAAVKKQVAFGLLIPNFNDMEIFDTICGQLAVEAQSRGYDLVWVKFISDEKQREVERVCEPFLRKEVSGVFFAPLEMSQQKDEVNSRIAATLDSAGVPLVLLDRDLLPFPQRSKHDLVGIDNYAAGHMLAEHFVNCGCKSITFVSRPLSAVTIQARIAGVMGALIGTGHLIPGKWNRVLDPMDTEQVREMMQTAKPDGIICGNDKTAAELMQTLYKLKVRVPEDVNVVGIDDLRYARLLQPALTTVHQPCDSIGTVAWQTMLERIANPTLPPRQIMLPVKLILRQSSIERSR